MTTILKKCVFVASAVVALVASSTNSQALSLLSEVYNTAATTTADQAVQTLSAAGALDSHYTLSGLPINTSATYSSWAVNTPAGAALTGSKSGWGSVSTTSVTDALALSPAPNKNGAFIYTVTFNAASDGHVVVDGTLGSVGGSTIIINGNGTTAIPDPTDKSFSTDYEITFDVHAGLNTLSYTVSYTTKKGVAYGPQAFRNEFTTFDFTPTPSPVPEPSTFALAALGLVGLGAARYRRRQAV